MSQSNLPKTRLNQIARRKLVQLGIPSAIAREQDDLEAEIPSTQGRIKNPFNGQPIPRARFKVEGHAHAVFLEPPLLTSLDPISFYECQSAAEFLSAINAKLYDRGDALKRLAQKLSATGIDFKVDAERALLTARIELNPSLGAIVLEGDASAIYAVAILPRSQSRDRASVPMPRTLIPFDQFADRTHLELDLSALAERALKEANTLPKAKPAAGSVSHAAQIGDTGELVLTLSTADLSPPKEESSPAPPKVLGKITMTKVKVRAEAPQAPRSLTLRALAEKLGDGALVGAGVAFVRELTIETRRVRFEAKHLDGMTFAGRMSVDGQIRWEERFAFDAFPGVEPFARTLLGLTGQPDRAEDESPHTGDLWTLRVVVERDENEEIRYVALNAEGQPYGAPRVLARTQFTDAFQEHGGGYRMLVKVLQSSGESVTYSRLDAKQTPIDRPRTVPYLGFVGQFVRD